MPEPSSRKIGNEVYWLSIPDTRTTLFENLWPIPDGINYNAYLVGNGEEYLLIDSSKKTISEQTMLDLIADITEPSRVKQVVVLHSEPDHSGLIETTTNRLANPKLYSTTRASAFMKRMLNVDCKPLKDAESLTVGNRTLRVIELPWIHWPDSMFLYLEDEGILFTSDAFGAFGALQKPVFDDEVDYASYLKQTKDYFSTVVVAHRLLVLRDMEKVRKLGLDLRMIAPAHGVVLRSKVEELTRALASWCTLEKKRKITVVYGSMYGLTGRLADFAADVLREKVNEVAVHDVVQDSVNSILGDIMDSAGTLFLTPTYEANVFPSISNLLELLKIKKLGERKLASAIVTKLWGGNAPASFATKVKEAGFTLFEPIAEYVNYPSEQELSAVKQLVADFSRKALEGI